MSDERIPLTDREVAEIITRNRFAKAKKLADYLQSQAVTAHDAGRLTDDDWKGHAKDAGINKPSSETRTLVIQLMKDREERG